MLKLISLILLLAMHCSATETLQGNEVLDHDLEERKIESDDEEFDFDEGEDLQDANQEKISFEPHKKTTDLTEPYLPLEQELGAGQTDLDLIRSNEAPYPGSSNEEFAEPVVNLPQTPIPSQSLGSVTQETDSGNKTIQHPHASKGLQRILEDGTYIYEESSGKHQASEQFSSKGIESIGEDGTYYYTESKTKSIENHPFKAKGLLEQKDGRYRYKVEESPREGSLTFRFGASTAPNFSRTIGNTTIDFKKIYKSSSLFQFSLAQEWRLFDSESLKLAVGVGFITAQGQGVFAANPGQEAPEKYDLYIIPVTTDIIYRGHLYESQKVLPFFGGGVGISGIYERRDDGKRSGLNMSPIIHGVAGIGLNMDVFDYERMNRLDATSGINDIYVTIEAHINQSLNQKLDFSTQSLALGFIVDY